MNVFVRIRRARAILTAGVLARALAWGIAAGFTLLLAAALIDRVTPLAAATRLALLALAGASALSTAAALLWRDRAVLSLDRVARWIEERQPSLEYALVTAVESGMEHLVPRGSEAEWPGLAARRAARSATGPFAMVIAASLILLALPAGAVARLRTPRAGDLLERASGPPRRNEDRLRPLVAQIDPPAYSGERPTTVDEPADLRALVGSTLTLRGRGEPTGILAVSGADTVRAVARGDGWLLTWRVSATPAALRLSAGTAHRIVAIEPVIDEPPVVALLAPARDSVLRTPAGRIALAAEVRDDYGIASAAFEFIVSSGEGESFTFKSGTLGAMRPGGRAASISATLSLDALGLKPGDIVHVRAVARDANDASGPGAGTSETRSIRIARLGEYDSVSVNAAPPSEADKSMISERMLIQLAEALEKKRPVLERPAVVAESRAIAGDQRKLRRAVGDIVFARLGGTPSGEEHSDDDPPARARTMEEMLARADSATNKSVDVIDFAGGESPVVAVNKPLLEAYNAMWDAGTQLETGEPGRAVPHMRRALAAIQRARQAERVYLRGRPPAVVIDLARARLQGKDKGATSARFAHTAGDSASAARTARFIRVVELSSADAAAAADSLLVLRIEALRDNPPFAAALADAASAIRRGQGTVATTALARARRALAGAPAGRDSIARWGGGIVP